MKRFTLLLLSALCTAATAFADKFQSGDLYYNITSENTVEVTYQEWSSTNYQGLTTATIPETVTSDGTIYSVTSIGYGAFYYCTSLTSITIPNSVTSIGQSAFFGCSSLTSITIPNSVTSIENSTFSGCSSLPAVDNLRYADTYLVEAVDKSLSTYTIKAGTKWIGSSAFDFCSSLTSITIPNSVTSIGYGAFYYCSSLTSIVIESGNAVYDSRENCNAIIETATNTLIAGCQTTIIPNSVTSIGVYAFYGCTSLTSITIPNSVTSIGKFAFYGCSSLTSIVVERGNTVYDSRNNSNAIIETATNTLITGCQSTTIPNSVTSIGSSAFNGCSSLTSITIPNSVTSIREYAFSHCSSLTSITIPNSVASIAYGTFLGCTALASVTIPSSVTSIEKYAFEECRKLRDIYCYAATPPTAQTNSFANYNVYVHVPCASLDAYDMDAVFGSFKYVECIGSEDADIKDKTVTIVPGNADATFTWPITDGAETYTLVITKEGVTFCTLVFNKQGQLVSIAFKPARQNAPATEGTTPANYAEQTANGFRFTVTNLSEGTAYAYTLTVRDAANSVLETYTGEFTTQSGNPMGIQESAGDTPPAGQAEKLLRNGQVLILRNGETYNMMGQML